MPQREQPAQPRDQPLAIGLVGLVAQRLPHVGRPARLQGPEEQRHALDVEHGIRAAESSPAARGGRRRWPAPPPASPRSTRHAAGHGHRATCNRTFVALAAARHPAEERRGGVVGVPLDLRRRGEDFVPGAAPSSISRSRNPAMVAAALLPRPARFGMSLSHRRPRPTAMFRLPARSAANPRSNAIRPAERAVDEAARQAAASVLDHRRDANCADTGPPQVRVCRARARGWRSTRAQQCLATNPAASTRCIPRPSPPG